MSGPLAAVRLRWTDWPADRPDQLVYADLDLADRASTAIAVGLRADAGDEAIVLAAHERWGERAPDRLTGQFAYALWDGARQRVVAVRDHVGLRPLVYGRIPSGLVVGGDMRMVLAADELTGVIDESTFVACVIRNHTAQLNHWGRTCYRDVETLRPAHVLVAGAAEWRQSRYWHPENVPVEPVRRVHDRVADLRDLLVEVVTDLTPSEGAIGTHLSGALDSSVVTTLVAQARRDAGAAPPVTFAWQPGPELQRGVDHDRIESVAGPLGLPVVYCPSTVESVLAEVYRDCTVDPSTMLRHELPVTRAASERGVTTILTGFGGDEAVSSSGRAPAVRELLRAGRVLPIARSAISGRSGARQTVAAALPRRRRRRGWHLTIEERREQTLARTLHRYLRPEVLRRAVLPPSPVPPPDPTARIRWSCDHGHLALRAADWARAGSAVGIAYRHPLLDQRLVRFALAQPPEVWLDRDGGDRWLLRAASAGIVADTARLSEKTEPIGGAHARRVRDHAAARVAVDLDTADPCRLALFERSRIETGLGERWGPATALKWLGIDPGPAPEPWPDVVSS